MESVAIPEMLNTYKEFGIAGLFLLLYLVTVFMFIRSLVSGKEREIERCEKMATLVVNTTTALREQIGVMEKLRESTELGQRETEKLLAYFQARDQHRKGG